MPVIFILFLNMLQCLFRCGLVIRETYFAGAEHGSKLVNYNPMVKTDIPFFTKAAKVASFIINCGIRIFIPFNTIKSLFRILYIEKKPYITTNFFHIHLKYKHERVPVFL